MKFESNYTGSRIMFGICHGESEFIFFTQPPNLRFGGSPHLGHFEGKTYPFLAELLCRVLIYDGKPSSWKDGSIENTWLPWVSFSPKKSAAKRCVLRTYTKLMMQFFDTVKFQIQIHNYNIPWTIWQLRLKKLYFTNLDYPEARGVPILSCILAAIYYNRFRKP